SGFVPLPSSKRSRYEYGPSKAPLPSFRRPAPSLRLPRHSASARRAGIGLLLSLGSTPPEIAGRQHHIRRAPEESSRPIQIQAHAAAMSASAAEARAMARNPATKARSM